MGCVEGWLLVSRALTQKKKKQEWYRVTGREVYGRALGVITTQSSTAVS